MSEKNYTIEVSFDNKQQLLVVNVPGVNIETLSQDDLKKLLDTIKDRIAKVMEDIPSEVEITEDKFDIKLNFGEKVYSTEHMTVEEKREFANSKKPKSKLMNVFFISLKFLGKIIGFSAKLTKITLAGASFALYAYMFTWKFALVIMVQLFIHEYGHIWAMKRCGIATKGIYFIPFFGGAAVASEKFRTRWDEVYVAIMGPVFGFMCAAASLIMWMITGQPFYAAASSWMAMLNVVNLIPINPLDGGRIMKSLMFSMRRTIGMIYMALGILVVFAGALAYGWWTLLILGILSFVELLVEWKFTKPDEMPPALSAKEVWKSIFIYLFMVVALAILMKVSSAVPGADIASELLK